MRTTQTTIQIEENVPFEPYKDRYPFDKMRVGDSFTIPDSEIYALRQSIQHFRYSVVTIMGRKVTHADWQFMTRRMDDDHFRCWRVK